MNKRYNILWADDEIASLYDDMARLFLEGQGIKVIGKFPNAKELRECLDSKKYEVDAVVVDANFPYEVWGKDKERETMGLQKVAQWVGSYDFPFILYTKRPDLVYSENKELYEYFFEHDYVVNKNSDGITALTSKIKEVVDTKNSPEWIVRNQYSFELDCLTTFDETCKSFLGQPSKAACLIKAMLVQSYTNEFADAERHLNDIRCEVFDIMNAIAAKAGIVPEGLSLNEFSTLLCYGNAQRPHPKDLKEGEKPKIKWKLETPVLNKALQEPMRYVLRMVQDGSHNIPEQVRQYIADEKKRENNILVRSILYTTIELVKWFMRYLVKNTNIENNKENIIIE